LAVLTFTAQRKLFWAGVAVVAFVVGANFGYFYQKVYKDNFYGSGPTLDISRQGQMGTFENDRMRMLRASVRYASEFPLGIGLGNYRSYNKYFGRVNVWNTTTFTSAHGTYAQTLSETGWLGLICFLLLLYASARALRGYYRALPPGWEKTYLLGAYCGVIGVFCASFNGDYLFPTYHNGGIATFGACIYTWFMIGFGVAIARNAGLNWNQIIGRAAPEERPVAPIYNRPDTLLSAYNADTEPKEPQEQRA
jgi:O-antigen ligase